MLVRTLSRALALTALLALPGASARAQYFYPYGYNPYGWGGWNSIGNVYGGYAAGLGMYAMGAGVYNEETAEANAINVNTAMHLNEYMYESLLNKDKRIYRARNARIQATDAAMRATQDRLRDDPTPEDIQDGDALNVALTELMDPRYSYQVADVAKDISVDGALLQDLPFRNAVEGITFSLNELSDEDPPAVFRRPEFAEGVQEYRRLIDAMDKQTDAGQAPRPEDVRKLRQLLQDADTKLEGLDDIEPEQKSDAKRLLKTMLGLTYMLEGPSLEVYLAEVKDRPISLAKLLVFMQSFNLRFGAASNPNQNQAMSQLYQTLAQAREKIFGKGTGTLPLDAKEPAAGRTEKAKGFFSGMSTRELDPAANRAKAGPGAR
jgi:hypothetical protein